MEMMLCLPSSSIICVMCGSPIDQTILKSTFNFPDKRPNITSEAVISSDETKCTKGILGSPKQDTLAKTSPYVTNPGSIVCFPLWAKSQPIHLTNSGPANQSFAK